MRDPAIRALRTFLQAFIGTFILISVPAAQDLIRAISSAEPYQLNFDFLQAGAIAGCLAGGIAVVTWLQNFLEEKSDKTLITK